MIRATVIAEQGWIPDAIVREGIRHFLSLRSRQIARQTPEESAAETDRFAEQLRNSPIAISTNRANQQHYELPSAFFENFLGPWRKYSSCLWTEDVNTLEESELAMLRLTAVRAEIRDGHRILDLGCGWGSFTLWAASQFPQSPILAVSNSYTQREYIEEQARIRGLSQVQVVTADLNEFEVDQSFDRIVSIECFEHLRNYEEMFRRVRNWLHPEGRCFLHVFCHRTVPYAFSGDETDWMGRHFFQDGIMPSFDLFSRFDRDLSIAHQWKVNGKHYARTLRSWLQRYDAAQPAIAPLLRMHYGSADAEVWKRRWRIFFQACAELFNFRDGNEWHVGHYLLQPKR